MLTVLLLVAAQEASGFAVVRPRLRRDAAPRVLHVPAAPELDSPQLELRLRPAPPLLAPDVALVLPDDPGDADVVRSVHRCFYHGDADDGHRAAMDLCGGGASGVILSPRGRVFTLRPLAASPFRQDDDVLPPHVLLSGRRRGPTPTARSRRSVAPGAAVYVETAVFVDEHLVRHLTPRFASAEGGTATQVVRVVLAMVNAVQLLYHDASLGRRVSFVLKRVQLLGAGAAAPRASHDIDAYLGAFCAWQRDANAASDADPRHWDHALLLTGLDLYVVDSRTGKLSSQVVGLAPVAGMCTASGSCTVNEGRHFESVFVVAHEIGHNLGMRHDGPLADNQCDPGSFIMSPTLGSGKITWSSCSRRYLDAFLQSPQAACLLDHGSSAGTLDHDAEGTLPGERFDADAQCAFKYGDGSVRAPKQPPEDACRDLHCRRGRHTWTSHPALEGTRCGDGRWCRGGRCVHRDRGGSAGGVVDGGWSEWTPFSDCASGCLRGDDGALRGGSSGVVVATRRCNDPRPEGGGRPCAGGDRRFQTCAAPQCVGVAGVTTRAFVAQVCGRARDVDVDLVGSGSQRDSDDPEEACTVWCHMRGGGSKSRGWTFPDGTACRGRSRRRTTGGPTYCVGGRCEEFTCGGATFALAPESCLPPPLPSRTGDVAGACQSSCVAPGRGLRLVVGGDGLNSVRLCDPDRPVCGHLKTPFEHATLVCSKYRRRVARLSGLGMQISATAQDMDRPCRVACQDEAVSHRFYLVNGEDGWFPLGTDCARGDLDRKAYCVGGRCLEFGLDDTPAAEFEYNLPLRNRSKTKRSVFRNETRVRSHLDREALDRLLSSLNLTGKASRQRWDYGSIDFDNPVHLGVDVYEGGRIPDSNQVLVGP